ncbi:MULTISPECIES: universal stress protein [Halomonadaceae]|uniref:Universal stress protein n=1 Tax=Vreelandella janggokensis TaxID=370767 RepID=A0ABT4IXR6_9GAMM|nr:MULTISPECIES: universal stress protein [Halomonas]MCW4148865.1 universal stress protein [Halomonas sp. 18H]MCZ0927953.1 universal stress protein [Halomonas janggokensis]MCZ0930589.1 universal stress protein [Halomonas janggokensis]MDR5884611.1 universal stress protein [Halomonas janggokensis]QPL45360.1 universal stress protein [Halomonas sp. A40-4]
MFKNIMVPVDLAHLETLEPALSVVADMAKQYDAKITYVGVTANTPTSIARTPQEYEQKLDAFAQDRHKVHGQPVSIKVYSSTDPVANVDDLLVKAIDETGADLVMMATHLPRHLDIVMPSHGGKVATHTDASVFLLRPSK